MTDKSTTVKPTKTVTPARVKVYNESKLELPQDIGGFSSNFRREAARSVGRIMADHTKLECFIKLCDTFKDYAIDRHEHQLTVRDVAIKAKADKLKAAERDALRTADAIIKSKRANVDKLVAEIAAHDKRMEASK